MRIGGLHWLDVAIVVGYLAAVVYIGKRASKAVKSEEGFFLAGRKLGKWRVRLLLIPEGHRRHVAVHLKIFAAVLPAQRL